MTIVLPVSNDGKLEYRLPESTEPIYLIRFAPQDLPEDQNPLLKPESITVCLKPTSTVSTTVSVTSRTPEETKEETTTVSDTTSAAGVKTKKQTTVTTTTPASVTVEKGKIPSNSLLLLLLSFGLHNK